jgi:hypothetical protein
LNALLLMLPVMLIDGRMNDLQVKTSAHKELPPQDANWYYTRAGTFLLSLLSTERVAALQLSADRLSPVVLFRPLPLSRALSIWIRTEL